MATKKTKGTEKGANNTGMPEGFWTQATAIGLIILSILLMLAMFGLIGELPGSVFDLLKKLVGVAAYTLPVLLLAIAVDVFRARRDSISRIELASAAVVILSFAGLVHTFADPAESGQLGRDGHYGGVLGNFVSSVFSSLLSTVGARVLLLGLLLVSIMYVAKVTVTDIWGFIKMIISGEDDKGKEAEDNNQSVASRLKINGALGGSQSGSKSAQPIKASNPLRSITGAKASESVKAKAAKAAESKSGKKPSGPLTIVPDPEWELPNVKLLSDKTQRPDAGDVQGNADMIRETLSEFKIEVDMEGANIGPRVTQYTLLPKQGVRLNKITSLESNIALSLAASAIRIEAPIPGKRAVGIEVPNKKSAIVRLRSVLESPQWAELDSPLGFAIGSDISAESVVAALDKMPHLLVAGATGSGKSVMINALLTSMLYRNPPSQLKLILVDPKQVELKPYNDIPHLLTPVIIDPEKCISALKWAVAEMERRYGLLSEVGKRNINEYNRLEDQEKMPYIVIVIDELADLMMLAARDVESLIVRIAQKARAVGIHLVLATQRPSVDVITGLIKANIPARIAFTVTSQIDSRTILDQGGAEKLLGKGDMLLSTTDRPKPFRVQAALIDDDEVEKVVTQIKAQRPPEYDDEVVSQRVEISSGRGGLVGPGADAEDSLYEEAVRSVIEAGKASTSLLQRRLSIGYGRAARIMETMEEQGVIGQADGSRPREILVSSADEVFGATTDDDGDLI